MNRFFKSMGVLSSLGLVGLGGYYLYQHFNQIIVPFFTVFGVLAFIALILRLLLDQDWVNRIVREFFIGSDLIKAVEKYYSELPSPKQETKANLIGHLIYRFTRFGLIGLIGILIAASTPLLVLQQNWLFDEQTDLIRTQTGLLRSQDEKFGTQNTLIEVQNEKLEEQTGLFRNQNALFGDQNLLVRSQNVRVDSQITLMAVQNDRINLQNNLIEAERRSSLVFLMSNVLDKVDDEIREQRKDLSKDSLRNIPDSIKFKLSKPLVSRIVALSRAFRPYNMLDGDTLSGELVSPERGQLFIALMENNLDSVTQNTIVASGDFSNAVIGEIDLRDASLREANLGGAHLVGADLSRADLFKADLRGTDLSRATLRGASFMGANLSGANLSRSFLNKAGLIRANLSGANLRGAWLDGVSFLMIKNLTVKQLIEATTLFEARGLPSEMIQHLEEEKHCIFKRYGCPIPRK